MAIPTITATQVRPLDGCTTISVAAGEAMTIGNAVRIHTDETALRTNAGSAAGVSGQIGIVVAGANYRRDGSILSGEQVTIVIRGRVYLGSSANLDESKTYWCSSTAGSIDDVAPAQFRAIGTPTSATVLNVSPTSTPPAS